MNILCPSCRSNHELPENAIPDDGLVIVCPGCEASFRAFPTGLSTVVSGDTAIDSDDKVGPPDPPPVNSIPGRQELQFPPLSSSDSLKSEAQALPEQIEGTITLAPGSHRISTEVVVPADSKLVILPGTRMTFDSGVGMTILGCLEAIGSEGGEICFEGQQWTGIGFIGPNLHPCKIAHAKFSGGTGRNHPSTDGGVSEGYSVNEPDGGAIYVRNTGAVEISIADVEFTDNSAIYGGAVIVQHGTLHLERAKSRYNTAEKSGGAISLFDDADLRCRDCTFEGNTATETGGSVFHQWSSASYEICMFVKNSAQRGGATAEGSQRDQVVRYDRCEFTENLAKSTGGACYIEISQIAFLGCLFERNVSVASGGAIGTRGSDVRILECTFEDNRALDGGAVYTNGSKDKGLQVQGGVFRHNQSNAGGGAIYAEYWDFTIESAMFEDNETLASVDSDLSSPDGGAIGGYSCSNPRIIGCKFLRNTSARYGGAISLSNTSPTISGCAFQGNHSNRGDPCVLLLRSKPELSGNSFIGNTPDNGQPRRTMTDAEELGRG